MDTLQEALIQAIVAAIFGGSGFFIRGVLETRKEARRKEEVAQQEQEKETRHRLAQERKQREHAIVQLRRLHTLLKDSFGVFVTQNIQRNRLMKQLQQRHQGKIDPKMGYNDVFLSLYDEMNEEERDLFNVVRGMTEYSLHSVNKRLIDWLDDYTNATELLNETAPDIQALDNELRLLRLHLESWLAMFNSNFKDDEKRSLVYLGDERRFGQEFPRNLEGQLEKVLNTLIEANDS